MALAGEHSPEDPAAEKGSHPQMRSLENAE